MSVSLYMSAAFLRADLDAAEATDFGEVGDFHHEDGDIDLDPLVELGHHIGDEKRVDENLLMEAKAIGVDDKTIEWLRKRRGMLVRAVIT